MKRRQLLISLIILSAIIAIGLLGWRAEAYLNSHRQTSLFMSELRLTVRYPTSWTANYGADHAWFTSPDKKLEVDIATANLMVPTQFLHTSTTNTAEIIHIMGKPYNLIDNLEFEYSHSRHDSGLIGTAFVALSPDTHVGVPLETNAQATTICTTTPEHSDCWAHCPWGASDRLYCVLNTLGVTLIGWQSQDSSRFQTINDLQTNKYYAQAVSIMESVSYKSPSTGK